jgi:DNA-binding NarL/FixJ family response regulator
MRTTRHPLRVLLADDSVQLRQDLRGLIQTDAIRVVAEAADGQEAVSLTQAETPDVAVLDVTMPALDGIEAARQIRKSSRTQVVLISASRDEYKVRHGLAAGAHGYVAKRDVADELTRAIREVSKGKQYLSSAVSSLLSRP